MSHKNISKRVLSLLISILIALSAFVLPIGAVEAEDNIGLIQSSDSGIVSPQWINVNAPSMSLYFSGGKIYAQVLITGISGTKYKNGTVTLSKFSGGKEVPLEKWTGLSSSRTTFLFSNSDHTAVSGVKYKIAIKITAYTSKNSEVINISKTATCP